MRLSLFPILLLCAEIAVVIAAPAPHLKRITPTTGTGAVIKAARPRVGRPRIKGHGGPGRGGVRPHGRPGTKPSSRPTVDRSLVKWQPIKPYTTLPTTIKNKPTMNDLRTIAKAAFAKEAAEAKNNGESKKKWRIDTECVAAAWYALRQALKIGGAAMVGEMLGGATVGGTQWVLQTWVALTEASDEELGEKMSKMSDADLQKILKENGIPEVAKGAGKEELIKAIDAMIEQGDSLRSVIEDWEGGGEASGDSKKEEEKRDLDPRARMSIKGLCEQLVPRVAQFKEAQARIIETGGLKAATKQNLKALASICPAGWVFGSVVKGVGEYVGGSKAGDLADEREAKEKAAKDKEKKEKEDKASKGDTKEKGSTKDPKAKDSKAKRARVTSASVPEPRATVEEVAACVPIITGLLFGAMVENFSADEFFALVATEHIKELISLVKDTEFYERLGRYKYYSHPDDVVALFVPF